MTISIIIPVYNVEQYIRRCIDSIIAQDCSDFDIECILVNDGSTDRSIDIIRDVIDKYTGASINFKIIHHKKNEGLCSARNTGINASEGDFLFFLDADDDLVENALKCLYSYSVKNPHIDVIMGEAIEMERARQIDTIATNQLSPIIINDKYELWEKVLRRKIDRHVWNKLVRRSMIVDNDLYFDKGLLYEDILWTYKLFSVALSVMIVPRVSYLYEYNPLSIVHSVSKKPNQFVRSFAFMCDYMLHKPPIIDGKKVLFVAHRLFVNRWMLTAIDIQTKYGTEKDVSRQLTKIKQELLWDVAKHFRPLMTLYFLIMFAPMKYLLKIRRFRSILYVVDSLLYKLGI